MLNYDVIVCGAGPAGASAAAAAASQGLKVALLEKQPLPRHKTCGGGMPMVVGDVLKNIAPDAFVESQVRYMRHTWMFNEAYLADINPPGTSPDICLWMVQRSIFDNALAQRAVKAGAELRDNLAVKSIEIEPDGAIVRASSMKTGTNFEAKAKHIIGADGASGITAKIANLRRKKAMAIAIEIEHPYDWKNNHPDVTPEIIHLEYGAIKNGYAWIFPKADHLNIGAGLFHQGMWKSRSNIEIRADLEKAIFNYLDLFGIAYQPEKMKFHGHPLPLWQGKEQRHTPDERILLAGDAAGLINPLFGDGILHAIKSGLIAAECVAQNDVKNYSQRINSEFAPKFEPASKLASFFYKMPHLCYQYGVKRPNATRIAARLLMDELDFNDMTGRFMGRIGKAMIG
ncbi:geranylgeranyl reductase family protein [Ancylothrix sp. C2]|uniref:NAD(P)/FAD-dependent oxidoreductase n=1 Tax=Ancylothrix sp. D3o TaxID=2953691 RepID=UPI0021BA9F69|nr:geranylgeranyl reductase family protein [Ancylothrix sp. D3o]MCT7951178.1 geranylgeranyl reductase family protein [Ancylothrix sp. D3o]